jgi:hypothetical protein
MRMAPDSRTIVKWIPAGCLFFVTSAASGAVVPVAVSGGTDSGGVGIELWLVLMLTLLVVARWLECGCSAAPKKVRTHDHSTKDGADHWCI